MLAAIFYLKIISPIHTFMLASFSNGERPLELSLNSNSDLSFRPSSFAETCLKIDTDRHLARAAAAIKQLDDLTRWDQMLWYTFQIAIVEAKTALAKLSAETITR